MSSPSLKVDPRKRGPGLITTIAVVFSIGVLFCLGNAIAASPILVFALHVHGLASVIIWATEAVCMLYISCGLFALRAQARIFCVAYLAVVIGLTAAELADMTLRALAARHHTLEVWVASIVRLILNVAILVYLLNRRDAFEKPTVLASPIANLESQI